MQKGLHLFGKHSQQMIAHSNKTTVSCLLSCIQSKWFHVPTTQLFQVCLLVFKANDSTFPQNNCLMFVYLYSKQMIPPTHKIIVSCLLTCIQSKWFHALTKQLFYVCLLVFKANDSMLPQNNCFMFAYLYLILGPSEGNKNGCRFENNMYFEEGFLLAASKASASFLRSDALYNGFSA